tara:strand:+ start:308 stop:646 length:339 start_codon:yes stop_codon:yes gene_type:complete
MSEAARRAIIACLNDHFRSSSGDGWVFLSATIADLPEPVSAEIINAVATFDAFTPDNDPHGEHDCAMLTVGKHRVIWKIDYYRDTRSGKSDPDPADATTTLRVLTIMLAEEY